MKQVTMPTCFNYLSNRSLKVVKITKCFCVAKKSICLLHAFTNAPCFGDMQLLKCSCMVVHQCICYKICLNELGTYTDKHYRKLQLLGACTYNFRRNFLKILPCLLSTCAYNAICHLWSPHIWTPKISEILWKL